YQAQELALYGKRIQPVAAVIEWLSMLLASPLPRVRRRAAESAYERVERFGQDIGPILPALGNLIDTAKPTRQSRPALWLGVAAIALTAWHFPQHRQAAAAEFTSRLNGKAVQREAASKGLAMIRTFAGDAAGVRELLDHPDDRNCIGAIRGFHDARREMN